nr:hypothetical protein [Gammaproteobacteria bacterium]NIY07213.1 hypothetical protein [Gemmatimonadota bacterium]
MKRTTVAVPEIPVRLRVNDRAVASWSCSPDALDALGAGRALALGFARGPEHILAVRVPGVRDGVQQIEVDVPLKQAHAAGEELDHRARHGCGLRFLLDCRRDLLPTSGPRPPLPGAAAFRDLFRDLFDRSPS